VLISTCTRAHQDGATMAELGATNAEIIAEFRANRGKVGGFFQNDALLLLTTTGRKTGKEHTIPLSYIDDDAQLVLIGANLASSRVSDWITLRRTPPSSLRLTMGDIAAMHQSWKASAAVESWIACASRGTRHDGIIPICRKSPFAQTDQFRLLRSR
jgi:hypothetical protein